MTSVQMKINHETNISQIIRGCMVGKCAKCVVCRDSLSRKTFFCPPLKLAGVHFWDPKSFQRTRRNYFMTFDGKGG